MRSIFPFLFSLFSVGFLFSQEEEKNHFSIEANYFYGNIFEHNKDIGHLIVGHPEGVMLSYNNKTYGLTEAERRYGYPDWGFTFVYQDMKNPILGDNYSAYGHYTWYFVKRRLALTVGTGVAYNTNPYDIDTNFKNNAYGTAILSTSLFKLGYTYENLWKGFGVNAGLFFLHYSNGNLKAPNTSTNTFGINAGITYQFNADEFPDYIPLEEDEPNISEPIKYNIVFRSGINQSDVIGHNREPFYVLSGYADKRLNFKSSLQGGIDIFFSKFIKEFVLYRSIAFPDDGLDGDEDYKRVGVFIGHELRFNRTAFEAQLGYYVYWPSKFENRVYNRLGLKRYFYDSRIFGTVAVKGHWAKAEAIEFGVGLRL